MPADMGPVFLQEESILPSAFLAGNFRFLVDRLLKLELQNSMPADMGSILPSAAHSS